MWPCIESIIFSVFYQGRNPGQGASRSCQERMQVWLSFNSKWNQRIVFIFKLFEMTLFFIMHFKVQVFRLEHSVYSEFIK